MTQEVGGEGSAMEKNQPPQLPLVPIPAPTQFANIATVGFNPGNGAIHLQVAELRDGGVQNIGDKPVAAIFELGRFAVTPRALRQLLDTAQVAAKKYEESVGSPLPTIDQFIARAAMPGLIPPPPQ